MTPTQRSLLISNDLKTLYKVTNPKSAEKPMLLMVIRPKGGSWSVESSYPLRGYRACQSNLESRTRQYKSKNLWPNQCDLGIGIFNNENLVNVLMASDLGCKPVSEDSSSLPLDNVLEIMGLTRKDL